MFSILSYTYLNISKCFLLLQFLVVYETKDSKFKKKKKKKKRDLRPKNYNCTIWFASFRYCPIPEIENLETSESFRLLQILII